MNIIIMKTTMINDNNGDGDDEDHNDDHPARVLSLLSARTQHVVGDGDTFKSTFVIQYCLPSSEL